MKYCTVVFIKPNGDYSSEYTYKYLDNLITIEVGDWVLVPGSPVPRVARVVGLKENIEVDTSWRTKYVLGVASNKMVDLEQKEDDQFLESDSDD